MDVSTLEPRQWLASPSAAPTRARRWSDLAIVLAFAVGPSIAASVYLLFHPRPLVYTNARALRGIVWELLALVLFAILFRRQGRKLKDLGLCFQWTDLLKGSGLYLGAWMATWVANYGLAIFWFFLTRNWPATIGTRTVFRETSLLLLLPFLLLNPVFEEVLVRGYLMTEVIELRSSFVLATVLSLALQTSYHLYYGLYGALIVGAGLTVLAVYYARSRRLVPVIVAHCLWDLTALVAAWHR